MINIISILIMLLAFKILYIFARSNKYTIHIETNKLSLLCVTISFVVFRLQLN